MVTLSWIKRHITVNGNRIADRLTKQAPAPHPSNLRTLPVITNLIKDTAVTALLKYPEVEVAIKYRTMTGQNLHELGVLIGHCKLRNHLCRIILVDTPVIQGSGQGH